MYSNQTLTEEKINVNGRKIYVQFYKNADFSQNPTLVFLHEALGSVAQWRDFPKKLGEKLGFNVLIYDRFGHGQSDALTEIRSKDYLHREALETTPSVLQHFNIENPILFGHSDGGTIALLFAAHFPTQAVITEAAHVVVEDITLDGIRQTLLKKAFLIEQLTKIHDSKAADLVEAWSDTWLNPNFRNWQIVDDLPKINCPVLLFQGQNDEYATAEHLALIAKNIGQNAQSILIPNCGHTPHRAFEDLILEKTAHFLARFI